MELYDSMKSNDNGTLHVVFIKEETKDKCQPLGTFLHRQLKYVVKHFYNQGALNQTDQFITRKGILKMPLVHLILSSPLFTPRMKYS